MSPCCSQLLCEFIFGWLALGSDDASAPPPRPPSPYRSPPYQLVDTAEESNREDESKRLLAEPKAADVASEEELERDKECAICLEQLCEYNPALNIACSHFFHLQCLLEWAERRPRSSVTFPCPLCGAALRNAELEMI
jgi:hypothetical protein